MNETGHFNPADHYHLNNPDRESADDEQRETLRLQHKNEFITALNAYNEYIQENKRKPGFNKDRMVAHLGSVLGRCCVKCANDNAQEFDAITYRNDLGKTLDNDSQAHIMLSGFLGEQAAMKSAIDMGANVYLSSPDEDLGGVDCWIDPTNAEISDLQRGDGTSRLIGASVKATSLLPRENFPTVFYCDDREAFIRQFDSHKDAFWAYYKQQHFTEQEIQTNWEDLREVGIYAADKFYRPYRDKDKQWQPAMVDQFDDMVPAVVFVTSYNQAPGEYDITTKARLPGPQLITRLVEGYQQPLDTTVQMEYDNTTYSDRERSA